MLKTLRTWYSEAAGSHPDLGSDLLSQSPSQRSEREKRDGHREKGGEGVRARQDGEREGRKVRERGQRGMEGDRGRRERGREGLREREAGGRGRGRE